MVEQSTPPDDATIPSRKRLLEDVTHFTNDAPSPAIPLPTATPWMLQQYFEGEIDLNKVLAGHFPQVPVMSTIHTGEMGKKSRLAVAALSTQDGAASVIAEMDLPSLALQFTFVQSSMLAMRFAPGKLTLADREQWLSVLRRESSEVAFLWDQSRWGNDYLIGVASKTFTNLFAFSPRHIEAAARLTPEVTRKLVEWLARYWNKSEKR